MPTATPAPKLLTTEDLAALFQVSKRKVQNLVRDAGLPVVRFGRALRFQPEAVARWLADHTEAGPPPQHWSRSR